MEAPAPGRMPIRLPMIHERIIVGLIILRSSRLRLILSVTFVAWARALIFFSARMKTCDMENSPMSAQVVLMPSAKYTFPNMNRGKPETGSSPIVESRSPRAPDMSPLIIDFDETPAIIVRPKIESQKYSADWNFSVS